jgi:signal transduction histidine kinase/DNA-binding response OmpR family regulator/putative methionine-R-sulfoxide reductase with GAF domain
MQRVEKPRILVVDDEERMCRSLDSLLTKEGYKVDTAADGNAAMEIYRRKPHDLVITDIKMPGMDGIRLLRELRHDDPDAMVILMTAYASLDTAVAAINTGAYDYILKPIEFTQLRLAVERALEKRELEQARQQLMNQLQEKNLELNRHVAELNALYQAGLALSQAPDLNSLLTRIIEIALQVIKASVGSVMLLDEDRGELTVSAAVGLRDEIRRETRIKLGNSIAGHVAGTGEPLLVTDIKSDPKFSKFMRGGYESNSLLCAPLKIKDRVLGVINMSDPLEGEEFTGKDLRLLVTFAAQAAVAIDDAENFMQLRKRLNELSVLYQIASELGSIDNSRDMTKLIYSLLKKIIDFDFTVWLSWSDRAEALMFNNWEGYGQEEAKALLGRQVTFKEKTIYSAALRSNAIKDEIESVELFKGEIRTLTAVPIITRGALYGVFCLGSRREDAISANDEYIASIVTSQATSIYERQQAILNATRLMAMGKMMSEISHDLKKPLTNIRGSLQIMRQRWPEIAEKDDFFATAEQELLRLNELVAELVDFSNPKKYHLEQKLIPDLIKRVLRLVEADLRKHNIEFVLEMEDSLPAVMINENEVVEVLLNLILNAIDAMPDGGRLVFAGSRKEDPTEKKPLVEMVIRDSGLGIAPELHNKVFDRYFTTKDSGTGLGLAICERIIMAHNGKIALESKVGKGTTFRISLPSA